MSVNSQDLSIKTFTEKVDTTVKKYSLHDENVQLYNVVSKMR